eukprot:gnl/Spiro4/9298_TR4897_c0_g1_i1.p1 gnl/Spiro4/9298_TR4897_c0_g1~~gnl/Spiro4/9298_TR4897_c0_g1_i1.p1  ORF type:complete len:407 (-),score=85.72 gnl/Spiro4/9298_TR4897_c0_g1_i1:109-1293(-)
MATRKDGSHRRSERHGSRSRNSDTGSHRHSSRRDHGDYKLYDSGYKPYDAAGYSPYGGPSQSKDYSAYPVTNDLGLSRLSIGAHYDTAQLGLSHDARLSHGFHEAYVNREAPQDLRLPVDPHVRESLASAIRSENLHGQDVQLVPIKRRVQVPCSTRVQVPCTREIEVPSTEMRDVPETKLVEVPTGKFRIEEEEYEEWEERETVKPKEIWVKRIVEVPVKERVPVKKVRQVQVPECVYEERTEYRKEEVPVMKKVTVPAMRWKEVSGTKWVEVEELRECRVEPVADGKAVVRQLADVHGTVEVVHGGEEKWGDFVEGSSDWKQYAQDYEKKYDSWRDPNARDFTSGYGVGTAGKYTSDWKSTDYKPSPPSTNTNTNATSPGLNRSPGYKSVEY